MNFETLVIEKIEIERFKKIRNLTIEPKRGANLLYGSYRSGKTSLCEFVQFCLYGADAVSLARDNAEDAMGKIRFAADGKHFFVERSVIAGVEEMTFYDADLEKRIETTLTPGEFLTGLDCDSFDLINYCKQARYETPVFKPKFAFLRTIASHHEETVGIYQIESATKELRDRYTNSDESGLMDIALRDQARLTELLEKRPALETEARETAQALEEIAEKIEENNRRCILLKADMAGFTDDLQLSRNKENAEDINKRIQAKEKNYRLAAYEVANKVGKLEAEELEALKGDYNRLSLAVTALTQARTAFSAAEDNLLFHEHLFEGEDSIEHYREEKRRLRKSKVARFLFRILAALLMLGGVAVLLFLIKLSYPIRICLAAGGAILLCGIAFLSVSTVFSSLIRKILERNQKNDIGEFYEYCDRLLAHRKTTQIYREQVSLEEERTRQRAAEKEEAQQVIAQKIAALGYTEEDGELLAICDEIIEANEALSDLAAEIQEEKENYRRLLATDVSREELTVSVEFGALQKELAFLTAQNDSLAKKKALFGNRLQEIRTALQKDPESLKEDLELLKNKIAALKTEFEALDNDYQKAVQDRVAFEEEVKNSLSKEINRMLSFFLRDGEVFLFDDAFELCYRDQRSVLPVIHLGGGLVFELGHLAFRLSLAQMLRKNTMPMIFDDSFAMFDSATVKILYQFLTERYDQFFIATSSRVVFDECRDTAAIFEI